MVLATIMENFAYSKICLTPKLKVGLTVSFMKPKHKRELVSWMQWINANLGILRISSILFFQWVWFCIFKQTLLGSHHSPEYCKLLFFLFPSVTACGDQNAAFYSKICGVTPSFLFCSAFMNWGFGKNTNKLHPLNSSAWRLQSEETVWTKIVFLSCLCIAKHTGVLVYDCNWDTTIMQSNNAGLLN